MLLDRFKVLDKVAIVTGAGRGIGAGSALALAEVGAHVVCAARTVDQIEAVAAQARALGRKAVAVPCDVNAPGALENVVQTAIKTFGRIDILVNNAGGWPPQGALDTTEETFEGAFHFNVTTAFKLTQLCVPHMLKHEGGAVVNISSGAGRYVVPGFVAYGTAKAALSFMTRVLAHEFAPRVRVNAIAVGAVETSALKPFLDDELRGKMEALTPMRRIGSVDDIATGVLLLATPAGGWITGKVFEIDGGSEFSNWPFPAPGLM